MFLLAGGLLVGGYQAGLVRWPRKPGDKVQQQQQRQPPKQEAAPPAPVSPAPEPPAPAPAPVPTIAEARQARDDAAYERALQLVEEGVKHQPQDEEWLTLRRELTTDLAVDFRFHYLPKRRLPVRTAASDQVRLTPDDGYYLTAHPSDRSYLYILQVTSAGELVRLCPNDRYVPTPNPVQAELQRVPDGFGWLRVDPGPGVEKIYLVAARWQLTKLEELLAAWEAELDPGRRRPLVEQIVARLEAEGRVADRVPGLAYGFYQFHHEE